MISELKEASDFLLNKWPHQPEAGIILGTGLSNILPASISEAVVVEYEHIPHFPVSTVESHAGKLICGKLAGKNVVAMQGRFHYYEGYSMQQITFPVRVMKMMGVKYLLVSNASGKLNPRWNKGGLMLITDHIDLLPENPLRGKNDAQLGPRFPDMSQPYSSVLNDLLREIAAKKGMILNEGVYAAVTGPNLETRAEYRFLRTIGADAVGMSTVPEVIVANHMSLPCCAISVLTDDCDPDNLKPIGIEEIITIAGNAEPLLSELFTGLISSVDLRQLR